MHGVQNKGQDSPKADAGGTDRNIERTSGEKQQHNTQDISL